MKEGGASPTVPLLIPPGGKDAGIAELDPHPAFGLDGLFWLLLSYCAGVGGSILIIGSAAGVVAMGLEKIDFTWYLKNISLMALLGYAAGIAVIFVESVVLM